MLTINTPAGHFQVAGVAFPDDPANAQAIRLYHSGRSAMDYKDRIINRERTWRTNAAYVDIISDRED